MKNFTPEIFLDQRKLIPHIAFILMALVATLIVSFKKGFSGSLSDNLSFFLLILIQLEVFIFIAARIFKELNANITVKEFTRIVLHRFVIFIITCFFAALIIFLIFKYITAWIYGNDLNMVFHDFRIYEFKTWVISTAGGLSFGAIIFIIIQWQDALKREQKLKEQNLIFQNETLRNQVNPHFLFNSLNTISSLVQTQPDVAEKFINNLSLFYRYILENGQKDKVPLHAELDFIIGYYNLHKIRDEEKIILDVETIDANKFEILPVSLQILLENAIKHNIAARDNPLRISIYIEDQFIVVRNNLQKKATQLKSTKIGLKNLSERVKLVSGRDLVIEETINYFLVKLPLL